MRLVRTGITREVVLTRRWAFKIPTARYGVKGFMRGCLANLSEQDWSGYIDGGPVPPNPVVRSLPWGLCNIYRTASEYTGPYDPAMFGVYGDAKPEHLGVVDGSTVLLDYDMHCGCWLQCHLHGPNADARLIEMAQVTEDTPYP